MDELQEHGYRWSRPSSQPEWPPLAELGTNPYRFREAIVQGGYREHLRDLRSLDYWLVSRGVDRRCGVYVRYLESTTGANYDHAAEDFKRERNAMRSHLALLAAILLLGAACTSTEPTHPQSVSPTPTSTATPQEMATPVPACDPFTEVCCAQIEGYPKDWCLRTATPEIDLTVPLAGETTLANPSVKWVGEVALLRMETDRRGRPCSRMVGQYLAYNEACYGVWSLLITHELWSTLIPDCQETFERVMRWDTAPLSGRIQSDGAEGMTEENAWKEVKDNIRVSYQRTLDIYKSRGEECRIDQTQP